MRPASLTAAAVCLIALGSHARGFEQPVDLKVLYAGDAKSERTADFRSFLEQHFATVGISDYLALKAADTKGYDVVILDWPDLPPRNEKGFQRPALERDYDRPTVLIGSGALGLSRHLELKVNDLCVCLGDAAHGIRTGHEIFHKPYPVEIRLEDRPTPSYYRYSPEGEALGRTMKVWKVQERGWSLEKPDEMSILPGMVSDGCGFEDSPDAEVISSGINMKSPAAVAIGRHGNFLLWGFYAAPSVLTPEARKCLVNAICYIRKFDGQKPLVHKRRGHVARQYQLLVAFWYKEVTDPQWFALSQPESLRKDPAKLAELHRQRIEDFHRSSFPEDVRRQLGGEPDGYIAYYRANLEYLHPPEGRNFPLEVDDDVKSLGLSNRKLPLLERCIAMLERNRSPGAGAPNSAAVHDRRLLRGRSLAKLARDEPAPALLHRYRRLQVPGRSRAIEPERGDRQRRRAAGCAASPRGASRTLARKGPGGWRPGNRHPGGNGSDLAHLCDWSVARSRSRHHAEADAAGGGRCRGGMDLPRGGEGRRRADDVRRDAAISPSASRLDHRGCRPHRRELPARLSGV